MKIAAVAVCFLVLVVGDARAADESFECAEIQATGFVPSEGNWLSGSIKPASRYRLRSMTADEKSGPLGDGGRNSWVMSSDTAPEVKTPCTFDAASHEIACNGVERFRMNVKTQRFFMAYLHGYVAGDADTHDTPYFALGLCFPP